MATAHEIAREYFPDANSGDLEDIIWSRTGFPCFWKNDDVEACFREQLLEASRAMHMAKLTGAHLCAFCNRLVSNPNEWRCLRCDAIWQASTADREFVEREGE